MSSEIKLNEDINGSEDNINNKRNNCFIIGNKRLWLQGLVVLSGELSDVIKEFNWIYIDLIKDCRWIYN